MKAALTFLVILALLLLGLVWYRHAQSSRQLNVEPHARKEIEKAKRR